MPLPPSPHPQPWQCKVLYHRLMLPNWLRQNSSVEWHNPKGGDDLNLVIHPNSSDWENIFRVPLIPEGVLKNDADITVKMTLGVMLPKQRPDPVSYMISDRHRSIGVQILSDNDQFGPYKAVEGHSDKTKLNNPNVNVAATVKARQDDYNADQFELTFKPSETFGSARSSIDDKIVALYGNSLELGKGLWLELYRLKSKESYTINYIEITVFEDSKPCEKDF